MILNDKKIVFTDITGMAHLFKYIHIIFLILPPNHPSRFKSFKIFFRLKDISIPQIEFWNNGEPWEPD